MRMKREVRVIAYSNDSFALATAGFPFALKKFITQSERTESTIGMEETETWRVISKNVRQVKGINPNKSNPHYLTIVERLQKLPRGFTPKIKQASGYFQPEGTTEIYIVIWIKDTIHTSHSFEQDYQSWILKQIRKAWKAVATYYKKFDDNFKLEEFRPSVLVLESIRSTDNPKLELANNEEFLRKSLLPALTNQNQISPKMFDLVWREQRRRGVWEYRPREVGV